MSIPEVFDARSVQPKQGGSAHPPGMHDFQITNTYLQENSAKSGAMLVVEMTSPVGVIENRYNVINPNQDAVRIANEQLSALCHAVNIFQVAFPKKPDGVPDMQMAGHTLRGGRGKMEIIPQMVKGPDGKLVENGYMKVNKVFDSQGNEPGKPGSSAPLTQQSGGWGNTQQPQPQQQQPTPQQQPQNNWGNGPAPQQQPQPNNPAPNQGSNKPSWAT